MHARQSLTSPEAQRTLKGRFRNQKRHYHDTATTSKAQCTNDTTTAVTLDTKGLKAAARFLERQGYDIIERDWECKFGNMDLIVCNEDALVFVEVKTRSNEDRGLRGDVIADNKRAASDIKSEQKAEVL